MWKYGNTPAASGHCIVIPLIKSPGLDRSVLDNYRGITLSLAITKVFEKHMINLLEIFFYTSELQCGFKSGRVEGVGRDAVSMLCNCISYYVGVGSTVNVVSLDISKAFDKVNIHGLINKLLERNVPKQFALLMTDWYSKIFVSDKGLMCFNHLVSYLLCQGGVYPRILEKV